VLITLLLEYGLARVDAGASFSRLGEFMMIEEKAKLAKKRNLEQPMIRPLSKQHDE